MISSSKGRICGKKNKIGDILWVFASTNGRDKVSEVDALFYGYLVLK